MHLSCLSWFNCKDFLASQASVDCDVFRCLISTGQSYHSPPGAHQKGYHDIFHVVLVSNYAPPPSPFSLQDNLKIFRWHLLLPFGVLDAQQKQKQWVSFLGVIMGSRRLDFSVTNKVSAVTEVHFHKIQVLVPLKKVLTPDEWSTNYTRWSCCYCCRFDRQVWFSLFIFFSSKFTLEEFWKRFPECFEENTVNKKINGMVDYCKRIANWGNNCCIVVKYVVINISWLIILPDFQNYNSWKTKYYKETRNGKQH